MQTQTAEYSQALKVLIVEDENLIARDIRNLLTDWGYKIAGIAANADAAQRIFEEQKPDLVLVDVQLQGDPDGIETVAFFNKIRRTPIIYLTAQADTHTVERAKSTQPAAYLLKPFDERHLQISLDLAFSNFYPTVQTVAPPEMFAHEVKLNADVLLKRGDEIFVKQNYRFVKFRISEIRHLEADHNHCFIFTKEQKFVVRIQLSTVLERLASNTLLRVHRSFAINTDFVDAFSENEICVSGKKIPFSNAYRADFYKIFQII